MGSKSIFEVTGLRLNENEFSEIDTSDEEDLVKKVDFSGSSEESDDSDNYYSL